LSTGNKISGGIGLGARICIFSTVSWIYQIWEILIVHDFNFAHKLHKIEDFWPKILYFWMKILDKNFFDWPKFRQQLPLCPPCRDANDWNCPNWS